MNEVEQLKQRVQTLENLLANLVFNGEYRFLRNVKFGPNASINVTQVGASGDAIGFYGVTKVVKAGAISAPNSQGVAYSQSDANTIVTAVNALRVAVKNIGITA